MQAPSVEKRIDELIKLSARALQKDTWDTAPGLLGRLKLQLQTPEHFKHAWEHGLQGLLESCFGGTHTGLRRLAVDFVAAGLLLVKDDSVASKNFGLVKSLLYYFIWDILRLPERADQFKSAFAALATWCGSGTAHTLTFLDLLPMEEMVGFDFRYYPTDTLLEYTRLIVNIMRHKKSKTEVLDKAVDIFNSVVRCPGHLCPAVSSICEVILETMATIDSIHFLDEIVHTRLLNGLSKHIALSGSCDRSCLKPMMEVIVEFTARSNMYCQQIMDQGILTVISKCIGENRTATFRLVCTALKNIFACSDEHINQVMQHLLVTPIFLFREDDDESLRQEARDAMKNFLLMANSGQMFKISQQGFIPEVAKLLRSPHRDSCIDGLRFCYAIINGTREMDPPKLVDVRNKMLSHDMVEISRELKSSSDPEISAAANGLYNFLDKTPEPESESDPEPEPEPEPGTSGAD